LFVQLSANANNHIYGGMFVNVLPRSVNSFVESNLPLHLHYYKSVCTGDMASHLLPLLVELNVSAWKGPS